MEALEHWSLTLSLPGGPYGPSAMVFHVMATPCGFLIQTPLVNFVFGLSFHLRHYLGQSDNFEMGKQLSEVSNSEFYLINFRQKLILLIILQPIWGTVFWPPDLKFCIQVRFVYVLGYVLNFFSSGPIQCEFEGGPYGPPPVVMSCLDTRG